MKKFCICKEVSYDNKIQMGFAKLWLKAWFFSSPSHRKW